MAADPLEKTSKKAFVPNNGILLFMLERYLSGIYNGIVFQKCKILKITSFFLCCRTTIHEEALKVQNKRQRKTRSAK